MPHYQIKSRWTGAVLFEGQFDTMRLCIEAANLAGANLAGADLAGANLAGANLDGAVIRDSVTLNRAPIRTAQRSDGYTFFLHDTSDGYRTQAGCRWFTFDEAWAHWCGPNAKRRGTGLGDETQDILVMFSLALDRVEGGA